MALPVIANVFRCSAEGTLFNGAKWVNVFNLRKDGALSYPAAIAIADPIVSLFWRDNVVGTPGWAYYANNGCKLDQMRYLPLDGASAATIITHAVAGANAGEALPAQNALVVSMRTGLRGPRHRGRIYLAGLTEASNTAGGAVTAGTITDLLARFTARMITGLAGSGVTLVVASYKHADANDVTSVSIDGSWDLQRRRRA